MQGRRLKGSEMTENSLGLKILQLIWSNASVDLEEIEHLAPKINEMVGAYHHRLVEMLKKSVAGHDYCPFCHQPAAEGCASDCSVRALLKELSGEEISDDTE